MIRANLANKSYKELKEYLEHLKNSNNKREEMRVREIMKNKIIEHKKKNKKVTYKDDLSFLDQIDLDYTRDKTSTSLTSIPNNFNSRFNSEFDIMKCIKASGSTSFTKPYI